MEYAQVIVCAANTSRFLAALIHGIASGMRPELVIVSYQDAKDHFESLEKAMEEWRRKNQITNS